jgi:hypothetical protein
MEASMNTGLKGKWPLLICVVVSACTLDTTRPCDPSLERILPAPSVFSEHTVTSTPDRGVSLEIYAHPDFVCNVDYMIPGGAGATLDVYVFNDRDGAIAGYKELSERIERINPEFDTPEKPPAVTTEPSHADDIKVTCHTRVSRSVCSVVARYGLQLYALSISQDPAMSFIQDHLLRIIDVMDTRMLDHSE